MGQGDKLNSGAIWVTVIMRVQHPNLPFEHQSVRNAKLMNHLNQSDAGASLHCRNEH